MRWAIALGLLSCSCVGFHSLHARGQRTDGSSDPLAMEASVARPTEWQVIGQSQEGRPIRMRRIGHGPRRVIWVGGIHGTEREGALATERLPDAFAREPGALEQVTLTIVEDINPDGSARGTRGNARGVDLNRNYPANNFLAGGKFGKHPLDQPEAKALHDLVLAERPHLVNVAHSWGGDHFINFDGPAVQHAELFASRSEYRVKPSDRIHPTPGSLGSWIGRKLQIPILTLEYERGRDQLVCWLETREAILAVILSA